jgi:hypothetical protein
VKRLALAADPAHFDRDRDAVAGFAPLVQVHGGHARIVLFLLLILPAHIHSTHQMATRTKREAQVNRSASLYEYTHRLHLAGLERSRRVAGIIQGRMEKQRAEGSS